MSEWYSITDIFFNSRQSYKVFCLRKHLKYSTDIITFIQLHLSRSSHRRCSVGKEVFLKISQISQENTCSRVSFLIELQAETCSFIKKDTLAQVFSFEFCEISKNTFFTEHLWETASMYGIQVGYVSFWIHLQQIYQGCSVFQVHHLRTLFAQCIIPDRILLKRLGVMSTDSNPEASRYFLKVF